MCRSACSWRLAVHTGGSLASIFYEVSDDSLSRLVARIGCRVSPHVDVHMHSTVGRPIGGAGRVRCTVHVASACARAAYEILNETSKY